MIGLALCMAAFAMTWLAGRRSLRAGVCMLLAIGYVYGIVRANALQTFTHFMFDAAIAGLFATQLFTRRTDLERARLRKLMTWLIPLVGWPILLTIVPIQDPIIQLVGLRAAIFMLPFLLLGGRLTNEDVQFIALSIAGLNLFAFGFAVAEFILGVEPFFPRSAVTEIIYRSKDLAEMTAYRIPSTFSSAHAYAGTLVLTLPLLLGVWWRPGLPPRYKVLLALGSATTVIGIFMAGPRLPAVVLFIVFTAALFSSNVRLGPRAAGVALALVVGALVSRDVRLQRFTTLQDTEFVAERVQGSVNKNFVTLVQDYPIGNGLGGGGTSIPFFLQDRLRNPIGMENEYARIVAEQGLPGLILWLLFIVWMLRRAVVRRSHQLFLARRLAYVTCAVFFAIGLIGTGLFTAIPQTALMLLYVGWIVVPPWSRVQTIPQSARRPSASGALAPAVALRG